MNEPIKLVDNGRGLQLSTSRVTVQDLVPYLQQGHGYEEIVRWIPTLTREEVAVVAAYYRDNRAVLDEQDRQIRERRVNRRNPAWVEQALDEGKARMAALREELSRKRDGAVSAIH